MSTMPSEFTHSLCPYCQINEHFCSGCRATLSHTDCGGNRMGICDDCQPLMQARP